MSFLIKLAVLLVIMFSIMYLRDSGDTTIYPPLVLLGVLLGLAWMGQEAKEVGWAVAKLRSMDVELSDLREEEEAPPPTKRTDWGTVLLLLLALTAVLVGQG